MNDSLKKTNPAFPRRSLRKIFRVLLCAASVTATAIGCGWIGTSHSVRFNQYQTEREMGRLPPLPTLANGMNDARAYWDNDSGETDDYTAGEKRTKEVDALWERAEKAEQDGNLHLDRDLLNEYLKRTEISRDVWFYPAALQRRRNSAIDRLDALSALDRGSNASKVKSYLGARHAHDSDKPAEEEIQHALDVAQSDLNLKDNIAYLKAGELYRQEKFDEAAEAFDALVRQYPRSEKREAALFMAAIATMKTSANFIAESGDQTELHDAFNSAPINREPVYAPAPDQAWHEAVTGFKTVIRNYPRGRYSNDARGWLAYLSLRNNDRADALAQYYRLLANKHDENARIEAVVSLTLVRHNATDDEMSRVERGLANEPDAALAYAYHNIYNYAIDPGQATPPYDENPIKNSKGETDYEAERLRSDEREKEWSKKRAATGRKELTRTLEFSKRLIERYPRLSIGGAFALRAAQASEELEDNAAAAGFARRALQNRLSGDERAQGLWTLAVAEHRMRHFKPARQSFITLLREYPGGPLTEGARRNLAMIAEDDNDIEGALEQYIALNYKLDVGYFVDTLMTPEQLAGFIQHHPDSPEKNEFTYALGVRYLRANRWEDARRTLAQVRTTTAGINGSNMYCSTCNCRENTPANCEDPKTGDYDVNDNPVITPRLVMRDTQTANDLEALERTANQAEGDEAKAEALYQYASYQYEGSSLLFYNPLASPGYWNLGMLASEGRYRVTNEQQILWKSTQEHDRLARALNIYLDIAARFPRTRAARDALYTGAVCHERLSNYNPYWREIYQNGLHASTRMVTYQDVKAAYPNYQLPRGTYGWQPTTRTVHGGPGWQSTPKPPLRLTRTARLKLLLQRMAERSEIFWREKVRRWLIEIAIVLGLLLTGRIAARNRRRLRTRIARHRIEQSRQAITYPWFEMFWIDRVEPSRRDQIRKFLGEKRQEFRELARDRRSRPVLVRNIVSHSLLIGLLMSLIWTAVFG
jgi:TolA-binding protein